MKSNRTFDMESSDLAELRELVEQTMDMPEYTRVKVVVQMSFGTGGSPLRSVTLVEHDD